MITKPGCSGWLPNPDTVVVLTPTQRWFLYRHSGGFGTDTVVVISVTAVVVISVTAVVISVTAVVVFWSQTVSGGVFWSQTVNVGVFGLTPCLWLFWSDRVCGFVISVFALRASRGKTDILTFLTKHDPLVVFEQKHDPLVFFIENQQRWCFGGFPTDWPTVKNDNFLVFADFEIF